MTHMIARFRGTKRELSIFLPDLMNKKTWEQDHTVCEQQDHFPQISVLTSLSRFRRKDDLLFALVSGICADESCKPVREQSDQDMTLRAVRSNEDVTLSSTTSSEL